MPKRKPVQKKMPDSPATYVFKARKALKMTQVVLATRLGFRSYATILNYEKGKTPVPPLVMSTLRQMLQEREITIQ